MNEELTDYEAERAARLFGVTEAFRERGTRLPPAERAGYEQDQAAAQTVLGAAAFTAAWNEGRTMSLEQAVAYALDTSTPR